MQPGLVGHPHPPSFMSRIVTFSPLIIRPPSLYITPEFPVIDAVGQAHPVVQ